MSAAGDSPVPERGIPDGCNIEVGDDGELSVEYEYWGPQIEVFEAIESGENDLVVYRGGYGSGKTVVGARWTIEVAERVPRSDNLILAQDQSKGGPTTYKGFFQQLPGVDCVPDEGGDPENSPLVDDFNRNKSRVTWHNGSVVRLGSADSWNRYAGGEFNAIWADEVGHYTCDLYQLHEMLVTRQRTEHGPNVTLWTSTGNGYNQFYDITERQVDKSEDALRWADQMEIVVANSLENPFLPEKEKLRNQFEGTARADQALRGGFAAADGLVYDDFNRHQHVISPEEAERFIDDSAAPVYGYDHGWDDPRVILDVRKTSLGQYVVSDLFYEEGTTIEDAIGWLEENEKPEGVMYAEHEPEHILKFRKAGYQAVKAQKNLDIGIPAVRKRLEHDSTGRPGLMVSERCTPLIQEFLDYQEDEVGRQVAKDHALDALRYVIMGDTRFGEKLEEDEQNRSGVSYIGT